MARDPNRMQEATARLTSRLKSHAAVTVTYSRGATVIEDVSAAVGRTEFEIMQGEAMIAHESRDYLIEKSDLVAGITQWVPQSGDRITESDGRVYEVSVPRPFHVYESMGPDGTTFKIHTTGPKP